MGRPTAESILVDTPTRILNAAEQAFALAGLAGAKLADIARAAGIRRPSLLYHFASKERLYAAVVERAFAEIGEILQEAMGRDGSFVARLRGVVEAFGGYVDARPQLARLILQQGMDDRGPGRVVLAERVGPLLDGVVAWIAREGRLDPDLPVRQALLAVCTNILVRAASGDLRPTIWGAEDQDWTLVSVLLRAADAAGGDA